MFRKIRIAVLLLILINVGVGTWLTRARTTSWEYPLRVAVFPINGDGSAASASYIANLKQDTFAGVAEFMRAEGKRYGLAQTDPVDVYLASEIHGVPPPPPFGGNPLQVGLWSLQMRFWAWKRAHFDGPKPHVQMFVIYHDPARVSRVAHSLGLQKGLIGVVNAFASESQAAQNNIVITHELLHTVGATDKYDLSTNEPLHPDGYAEPDKVPLLPQTFAEIMAGRTPYSTTQSEMPGSLDKVLIGTKTAREINWVR